MATTPQKRIKRLQQMADNEVSTAMPISIGEDTRRILELREFMECPVCLSYPRRTPAFHKEKLVYSCKNSHIVCGPCHEEILKHTDAKPVTSTGEEDIKSQAKCPTCRDEDLSPSMIASKILEKLMVRKRMHCKNVMYGCDTYIPWEIMWYHETSCEYREITCFSKHGKSCSWVGPLPILLSHMQERGCAQTLKNVEGNEFRFASSLVNYSGLGSSVFFSDTTVCWTPTILVSDKVCKHLIYVTIKRHITGEWYIIIRSVSPPHVREQITYDLKIFQNNSSGRQAKCTWKGSPVSHDTSDQEVFDSGEYLTLNDGQLRKLSTLQCIFEYEIELKIDGLVIPVSVPPQLDDNTRNTTSQE